MKKLLTILVVVIVAVALTKNWIASSLIGTGVKVMTGLTLKTDKMHVGILKTAAGVEGLRLHNPSGFPEPIMVDMPELFIDYNLGALLQGKVHLEEVRLNLAEFAVVKNEAGELNLDALKAIQASKASGGGEKAEGGKSPEIQIDALALKIGKVVYKDYSKGTPPKVQEFNVNIDEQHTNITNPAILTGLIVSRALVHTTVAKLTGFDLGALQGQLDAQMAKAKELAASAMAGASDAMAGATDSAKDAAARASSVGKEALGSASESLKGAGESIKGAAGSLKKLNPFGGGN